MPLLLARVDDRLIHGQVVVGCCEPLRARRIVLCDDEVANDAIQRQLFALGVPSEIEVEILDRGATISRLAALESAGESETTVLVVARCAVMRDLVVAGAPVDAVTLGGLHARPGAEELWPGFFLDVQSVQALREILDRGISVRVQTVPGAEAIDAAAALARGKAGS